jgi:hypothetical protein
VRAALEEVQLFVAGWAPPAVTMDNECPPDCHDSRLAHTTVPGAAAVDSTGGADAGLEAHDEHEHNKGRRKWGGGVTQNTTEYRHKKGRRDVSSQLLPCFDS